MWMMGRKKEAKAAPADEADPKAAAAAAPTARELARKAADVVPYSTLSEAIEAGKQRTAMLDGQYAEAEARDRDDPTIAFRDKDSAGAWSARRVEAEAHRAELAERSKKVKRDPAARRLEKVMEGIGAQYEGSSKYMQQLKPLAPVLAVLLNALYYVSIGASYAFGFLAAVWAKVRRGF